MDVDRHANEKQALYASDSMDRTHVKTHLVVDCLSSDVDRELLITVDNEMELYIDGVPNPINDDPSAKDWKVTKRVNVPAGSRVIAVKATDKGLWAGLLASVTDDSLLSDGTWKVSTVESDGWTTPEFDDSNWEPATVLGQHGMEPWKTRNLISSNAKWIWTATSYYKDMGSHVVYFRYRIGMSLALEIEQYRHLCLFSLPKYCYIVLLCFCVM